MTIKQAEALGFHLSKTGRFFHYASELEFVCNDYKKMSAGVLIEKFGNLMFEQGKKYGKELKTEEIKKSLNIQ